MAQGDTRVAQRPSGRVSLSPDFAVTDEIVTAYREYLESDRIRIDEEAFAQDLEFIKAMIHYRIAEAVFSLSEAQRHLVSVDPQTRMAMSMFGEAARLGGLGRGGNRAN
jgi:hypothetical protein